MSYLLKSTSYLLHEFFYVIRDKRNGMLYAGSKFSKIDSYPELFMTPEGYQTSSPTIHKIIEEHGLDVFEVVKLRIREDAYEYETRFLRKVDAKNNPRFYNAHNNLLISPGTKEFETFMLEKYGVTNANYVPEIKERANKKISETMLSEEWINGIGKKAREDVAKTKSDPKWKETIGKDALAKQLETKSDPDWLESVGKPAIESRIESLSEIKENGLTGFQLMEQKRQKTISDPNWLEEKGKAGFDKISKAKKGSKKLIKDGRYKMAIPNSERWNQLIDDNWVVG